MWLCDRCACIYNSHLSFLIINCYLSSSLIIHSPQFNYCEHAVMCLPLRGNPNILFLALPLSHSNTRIHIRTRVCSDRDMSIWFCTYVQKDALCAKIALDFHKCTVITTKPFYSIFIFTFTHIDYRHISDNIVRRNMTKNKFTTWWDWDCTAIPVRACERVLLKSTRKSTFLSHSSSTFPHQIAANNSSFKFKWINSLLLLDYLALLVCVSDVVSIFPCYAI